MGLFSPSCRWLAAKTLSCDNLNQPYSCEVHAQYLGADFITEQGFAYDGLWYSRTHFAISWTNSEAFMLSIRPSQYLTMIADDQVQQGIYFLQLYKDLQHLRFKTGTVLYSFCKRLLVIHGVGKLELWRFSFNEVREFAQSCCFIQQDLFLTLLRSGTTSGV